MFLAGALFLVFITCAAGCGGTGSGSLPAGVLQGTVTIGPLCPVEPCQVTPGQLAAAYAAREMIVYNADRSLVIRELSLDQTGKYMTALTPGQYIVDINHVGIDKSPDVPKTVMIESGKTTTVDISIDTGLR
jgi:hypothetical protein